MGRSGGVGGFHGFQGIMVEYTMCVLVLVVVVRGLGIVLGVLNYPKVFGVSGYILGERVKLVGLY